MGTDDILIITIGFFIGILAMVKEHSDREWIEFIKREREEQNRKIVIAIKRLNKKKEEDAHDD